MSVNAMHKKSEINTADYIPNEQQGLLPTWKLIVQSDNKALLHFTLPVPRFMIENDVIHVECSLLDIPLTKCEIKRSVDKSKIKQPRLTFCCEFDFKHGIYHALFHSMKGKYNYDNYQTANECFRKAIDLQPHYHQLKNDYETLHPIEMEFKLQFRMNIEKINEMIALYNSNKIPVQDYEQAFLWINLHFPYFFPQIDNFYGPRQDETLRQVLNKLTDVAKNNNNNNGNNSSQSRKHKNRRNINTNKQKYKKEYKNTEEEEDDDEEDKKNDDQVKTNDDRLNFEIKYSAKNIFIGLNMLMTYYEQIRVVIYDCLTNGFDIGSYAFDLVNLLFQFISFDGVCPTLVKQIREETYSSHDTRNEKYVDIVADVPFDDDYIGYNIKKYEIKNYQLRNRSGKTSETFYRSKISKNRSSSSRMTLNKFANWTHYPLAYGVHYKNPSKKLTYDTCNVDYSNNRYNIIYNKWVKDTNFEKKCEFIWKTFLSPARQGWIINRQMLCNSILWANTAWTKNNFFLRANKREYRGRQRQVNWGGGYYGHGYSDWGSYTDWGYDDWDPHDLDDTYESWLMEKQQITEKYYRKLKKDSRNASRSQKKWLIEYKYYYNNVSTINRQSIRKLKRQQRKRMNREKYQRNFREENSEYSGYC